MNYQQLRSKFGYNYINAKWKNVLPITRDIVVRTKLITNSNTQRVLCTTRSATYHTNVGPITVNTLSQWGDARPISRVYVSGLENPSVLCSFTRLPVITPLTTRSLQLSLADRNGVFSRSLTSIFHNARAVRIHVDPLFTQVSMPKFSIRSLFTRK